MIFKTRDNIKAVSLCFYVSIFSLFMLRSGRLDTFVTEVFVALCIWCQWYCITHDGKTEILNIWS